MSISETAGIPISERFQSLDKRYQCKPMDEEDLKIYALWTDYVWQVKTSKIHFIDFTIPVINKKVNYIYQKKEPSFEEFRAHYKFKKYGIISISIILTIIAIALIVIAITLPIVLGRFPNHFI